MSKRVAIIGAGVAGLSAIKSCKEEHLEPICFERNGQLGGLWRYHDEDIEGVASVMKTTIFNTGKEMSSLSDFPPPKDFPNFLNHSKMFQYLMLYAEKFDLLKHIRYNSEVIKVEPAEDYDLSGRWILSIKNSKTDSVTKEVFDAVMVCIGHHVYPKIPTFPGQEKFKGIVMHSHSVKSCNQFEGKRVVVVGLGNSGADVAVDCSFVAQKVYLSTKSGAWIFSRLGKHGLPFDMEFVTRKKTLINKFRSFDSICDEIEQSLNQALDHDAYNLKPNFRALSAHPTLNDFLPACILTGRITVKGNIQRFEEYGVVFEGESTITETDVVILATGYLIKFPFLGNLINTDDNNVHLYKFCVPPNLKHPTLGFIGICQPLGPIIPVSEMQARWFVQILTGNLKLPSKDDMEKDIKAKKDANAKILVQTTRHTIETQFIPFMDELAEQIGVKPNLLKLAVTDPKLFFACFSGPCLPYQYRLQGPHAWKSSRDAILTYEDRVFSPLNTRGNFTPRKRESVSKKKILFLLLISVAGILGAKQYFSVTDVKYSKFFLSPFKELC